MILAEPECICILCMQFFRSKLLILATPYLKCSSLLPISTKLRNVPWNCFRLFPSTELCSKHQSAAWLKGRVGHTLEVELKIAPPLASPGHGIHISKINYISIWLLVQWGHDPNKELWYFLKTKYCGCVKEFVYTLQTILCLWSISCWNKIFCAPGSRGNDVLLEVWVHDKIISISQLAVNESIIWRIHPPYLVALVTFWICLIWLKFEMYLGNWWYLLLTYGSSWTVLSLGTRNY